MDVEPSAIPMSPFSKSEIQIGLTNTQEWLHGNAPKHLTKIRGTYEESKDTMSRPNFCFGASSQSGIDAEVWMQAPLCA